MIRIITLSVNLLSGNLPSSITYELPNLERLYLSSNQLEGVIPPSLSNASKLTHLDLSANKFMGSIPGTIGDFRLLVWLDLSENNLTSDSSSPKLEIISSLTNCKDLRGVSLYKNPLNSILPDSIGNLSTSIERVYAYNCKIKGSLPDGIGNLTSLLVINLSGNLLSGSLPTTIKNLQNLQVLYLGENKLSKVVLDNFCGSQSLYDILLSQNQFSGSIPERLGNVTSLRYLDLDSNRLNSPIPRNLWNLKDLLGLNLSSNSLSGSLPLEFGNLKVARYIDLSMNKFSGDLPISVEGLKDLVQLSLAKNALQGSIRESFGEMISLVSLDLSHNNLSGLIPKSLEKLQYLTYLNVSFNNLRGEIPMGGPFQNFTSKSFIFNEALCGAPRFNVPPCTSTSSHRSRRKMVHRTIFIVLGTLAIVGAIALGFGWLTYKKKDKVPHRTNSFSIVLQERISYYELLSATNGYDQSNLLGTGSFGSVYRGTLNDGRVVAVKVFNLQLEGTVKSFEVECQILRNLRHRNLTKVISSCSNPDFKALVLEFMPNGSLQKWLYSSNYFLDIVQRLDIMIDTACALDYLHSGYSTPIVHCDLKPDNILLDHKMVAHVSDFGIAKLLGNEDSTTFTETIATFGYVAPEYGQGGSVSTKCDVYSYGIMLIEVFTRVQPNDERFEGNLTLRKWVNDSMPNSVVEVIDANLLRTGEDYSTKILDCLSSIMVVALNCSKESPKEKMNMGDVIGELNKIKLELLTYYGGKKL